MFNLHKLFVTSPKIALIGEYYYEWQNIIKVWIIIKILNPSKASVIILAPSFQ